MAVFLNGKEVKEPIPGIGLTLMDLRRFPDCLTKLATLSCCVGNGGKHMQYALKHASLSLSQDAARKKALYNEGTPLRHVVGAAFDSANGYMIVRTIGKLFCSCFFPSSLWSCD